MGRILFKRRGAQRAFFDRVIEATGVLSLRGLLQLGPGVSYSTLKNYYAEQRLIPEQLFADFCALAEIETGSFDFEVLGDSWGQVKGGRKSRRGKR